MDLETARNFLLWCAAINYGLLLLWMLIIRLAHDWHYRWTNSFFKLSVETYDRVNFVSLAIFKMAIILLNLVPYLALGIAAAGAD